MSKKYIAQNDVHNFVYANNTLAQYDTEIIHDLKEDTVTGTVSNFNLSISSGNLNVTFDYEWYLNSAEPFINNTGQLSVLSLHMTTPDKQYFKPWINVGYISDSNVNLTNKTGSASFSVSPSNAGVSAFVTGNYFFEVRFIGHRSIYPVQLVQNQTTPTGCTNPSVCMQLNVTGVTSSEGPFATIQYVDCNGYTINREFTINGNYYICAGYLDSVPQINSYTLMADPVIYAGYGCNGTGSPCPTGSTPFQIYYVPSSKVFTVGTAISTWIPTVSSPITGATISPSLPSGLTFNTTTGYITGTPLVASSNTTYTVSGFTATQSGTTTIQIEVDATPPPDTYHAIGSAPKVGATSCGIIGTTPSIYLNNADYAIYLSNGGCLSDGGANTISVIRNSDGSAISGTFYFVWYGGSCSTTTFKSTNGYITVNPTQC